MTWLVALARPVGPEFGLYALRRRDRRDVGNALLAIRDGRLYREQHGTFEEYCKEKWGFNASRARQLIGAAAIVENLKSVTIVTPATESQARPLAKLPPDEQPDLSSRAVAELCGVGHTIVDQLRPLASDANATRTTSDGRQYPARRGQNQVVTNTTSPTVTGADGSWGKSPPAAHRTGRGCRHRGQGAVDSRGGEAFVCFHVFPECRPHSTQKPTRQDRFRRGDMRLTRMDKGRNAYFKGFLMEPAPGVEPRTW